MKTASEQSKGIKSQIIPYALTFLGAFIAAFAIKIFFLPNNLIDGGTVGLAMIAARMFGSDTLPLFLLLFNLPFVYLAYRFIGKLFVVQLLLALLSFAFFLFLMPKIFAHPFVGENLEVVVIGGAILGVGVGMIIRGGACLDGTEILGIIINKKMGFTVGQTVFSCNILVFGTAGIVFQDWHPPILSLIAFIVVAKIMDMVIVGLDETKSVLVISPKSNEISQSIMHELGLGLTIMYGRGGFSGASTEILYIIIERLQLTDLKSLIYNIDPNAFIAIENLHEVSSGIQQNKVFRKKKPITAIATKALGQK
ncbi:MAG: YitT family protein [Verrucomicrobia bacterium]|nr:YitT family protein [Verrucomicrobiota bacterium]